MFWRGVREKQPQHSWIGKEMVVIKKEEEIKYFQNRNVPFFLFT